MPTFIRLKATPQDTLSRNTESKSNLTSSTFQAIGNLLIKKYENSKVPKVKSQLQMSSKFHHIKGSR